MTKTKWEMNYQEFYEANIEYYEKVASTIQLSFLKEGRKCKNPACGKDILDHDFSLMQKIKSRSSCNTVT